MNPQMKLITDQEQYNVCAVVQIEPVELEKTLFNLCSSTALAGPLKTLACKMSVHCPEFIGNKSL